MKKISYLLLSLLIVVSCSKETLEVDNAAFSSDSDCWDNKVSTGETITTDMPDQVFDKVFKIYGKVHKATEDVDDNGNSSFELGFIVTENSKNPGYVYLKKAPANENGEATWEMLNPCRGSMISGFWDGLTKNESKNARIIQQGKDPNKVYLFFGMGPVNKYKAFGVDNGEVLKAHNQPIRTLPKGFKSSTLYFHDAHRADFPPNWLGIKGKRLYTFGDKLKNTPEKIMVKVPYRGKTQDINGKIKKIIGANKAFKKRIDILIDKNIKYTLQKERKDGVNFYKK